ncbi:TrkH family potassium uptake protein [Denitromonas iodatirespirans]|uniref:Trk system potassium uptake protein n=1 Tax=Denitromonas iodatirespirans TaxID=2795389 RepID=A0A944D8G7_DENI1|nr:potassium transporter TrkG [Denitromonas iodatirespirans]MBT0959953.1 TrkH family potassium uptake protein [Denitromonas iodatirespirans]
MNTRSYAPVIGAFGLITMIFGLLMGFPLAVSFFLHDGATAAYDEAILITFGAGMALWYAARNTRHDLRIRDGFLLVSATWLILPVFAMLPLILYLPDMSFTDGYFEAASGLTTTGATVLAGLDRLPVSINLWRCFLHWIGGMGVIVLVVAILPLLGIGGRQMFSAEAPGPMKESSLTPRITETAKALWVTYLLLTIACAIALWLAGMPGWESLIHALSVMGLGGFSSWDNSIAHYDSPLIEGVIIAFACAAGMNFATHYRALHTRTLRPYRSDTEVGFFALVLIASIAMLTAFLMAQPDPMTLPTTLRHVAFQVVSLSTSLGLASTDYGVWPMFSQLWLLFLCSFVSCSGSTGGGIKMVRAIILYKQVFREITLALHPAAVRPVKFGRAVVPNPILHAVLAFGFIYMVSIIILTLLLGGSGLEMVTAFSAVIACINNTGPGLNSLGPAGNYAGLTDFQTWVCSFAMIIGRLEVFTLLVVLTPAFWRK